MTGFPIPERAQLELLERDALFEETGAIEARDRGMDRAEAASRVQVWRATATRYVLELPAGAELTADDLAIAVGLPDSPSSRERPNNVVGAMFSRWSTAGELEWTGRYARSRRVEGHGNQQRVWRRTR